MSELQTVTATCPKPGIYQLSEAVYHADPCPVPSLSASIASVLISESCADAKLAHPRLNPACEADESPLFDLGSAAHEMLLEQSGSRIAVCNYDNWMTKAARAERDAARAEGRYPILSKQLEAVIDMAAHARDFIATTELAGIFERGQAEQAIVWQEEGIWCRAKSDWLSIESGKTINLDYKTTGLPQARWIKTIGSDDRDIQACFYPRGLSKLGYPKPTFIWLVQRTVKPYSCFLVGMSEPRKEIGNWKVERAVDLWRDCMASDEWPEYDPKIIYSQPEVWESKEFTEALAEEE